MKKVNKRIISSFLFLMVLLLASCGKKSHYECEYKYDGSIYSESYDYKNNYGYEYFLDKNTNQAKLYEDTYLRSVDFSNKELNLNKKKKKDFALFFKAECKTYSLTINEIRQVFDIFVYENPIFYFISEINYELSSDYVTLEISKDYYQYKDRVRYDNLIKNGLLEIDELIKDYSDEFSKVKFIYDYIRSNMDYYDEDDGSLYWAHNIIGFFDNGEGVCETYTKVFILLCNRYAITAIPVYTTDHVWNMAKVYDMWYMFDLVKENFGQDEALYFSINNDEVKYDDVMIEVPKTANSSLSLSEIILYEDGVEIHKSHSIDDIYRYFKGGRYEVLLNSINAKAIKEKTYYINSINSNYESLKIYSNRKGKGGDFFLMYDTFIHFSNDLYITKDIEIVMVGFEADFPKDGNDTIIRVAESATFTYSYEGTWRFSKVGPMDENTPIGKTLIIDENGELHDSDYYSGIA